MTKKHFEHIAKIIKRQRDLYPAESLDIHIVLDEIVEGLSNYFATQNYHFNPERFEKACGYE